MGYRGIGYSAVAVKYIKTMNALYLRNRRNLLKEIEGEKVVMNKCTDVDAITKRLKRIEGQIRGLIRMVEEDKSCEDVLIQIGSAKAALHKTGQVILEGHLHSCVVEGIREGKEDETIDKLSNAIEQFSRIS